MIPALLIVIILLLICMLPGGAAALRKLFRSWLYILGFAALGLICIVIYDKIPASKPQIVYDNNGCYGEIHSREWTCPKVKP
jgi:hypothetical protein